MIPGYQVSSSNQPNVNVAAKPPNNSATTNAGT